MDVLKSDDIAEIKNINEDDKDEVSKKEKEIEKKDDINVAY